MQETTAEHPLAERFKNLFRAHPDVYGRTEVAEGYNEEGKRNSRSWLNKAPVTTTVWSRHLSGHQSIGCVPIKPNNMVSWGAIDVDVYEGRFDFDALHAKITANSLPFIVCRSKSGGGHIYLFLQGETLAKHMVAKLEAFAAFFGQGSSEIFPKQISLGNDQNDTDYGNWINMPYDGPQSLRYAQNDSGEALSMEQFLDYADSRKLSSAAFNDLKPPEANELLPEGPPCLNYIFSERASENELRNVTLANAAVYLKKAYGDEWPTHLNRLNNLFGEPLGDRELEALKKSYERKEYRYQCSKQPLCSYCDSRKCKQQQYGVGGDEIIPSNRSLTKLATEPPLWYLTIDDKRIALTTDQLFTFSLFNKRCLEVLNKVFQPYKQSEWLENLSSIASACTVIEVPEEMTPKGQMAEYLEEWLTEYSTTEGPEALLRGTPYEDNQYYFFRNSDLLSFLERKRFKDLERNQITSVITEKFKGTKMKVYVQNTSRTCWQIDKNLFEQPESITPTEPKNLNAF